jgi:hypothetical protein
MITGRGRPPGDPTRDSYERRLDERLCQQLTWATIRRNEINDRTRVAIDDHDDQAFLARRITLLQMQLAVSRARRDAREAWAGTGGLVPIARRLSASMGRPRLTNGAMSPFNACPQTSKLEITTLHPRLRNSDHAHPVQEET